MEGQRRLERELLPYSLGRRGSWHGKYCKQGKTRPDKWPLQSARWIRCNGLVISQAAGSHWASSAIFSDMWPCLLVIFWLGDLKRSGNLQQKRALSSVLCLPYHNGMYYGNCGYTFIWPKRMHHISPSDLGKEGSLRKCQAGLKEGEADHGNGFSWNIKFNQGFPC